MKKLLLILILTNCIFCAFSQDAPKDSSLKSLTKLDLGLQGVGFSYEPRLSNKLMIDLAAGLGGGYEISEGSLAYKWPLLQPALYFMVTPKFYYNRKKRIAKGKNFQNNAGNYFGVRLKYTTENSTSDYSSQVYQSALINVHWGIQRFISNKWILNAHAGAGYATNIGGRWGTVYPALELKFSYLFKRRSTVK